MSSSKIQPVHLPLNLRMRRGLAFGIILLAALLAFELFNYSTTDFALRDLLGDLSFAGLRWATILAIAFCGIDFAGIARLFTPEQGIEEPVEVWYLFGAWLLAATMNAMLTWWGVSIALLQHETLGSGVIERATLLKGVPVFVAIMVWLIRVLIIGTFSVAGERLFSQAESREWPISRVVRRPVSQPVRRPTVRPKPAFRPATPVRPRSVQTSARGAPVQEPTYQSVAMHAQAHTPEVSG